MTEQKKISKKISKKKSLIWCGLIEL